MINHLHSLAILHSSEMGAIHESIQSSSAYAKQIVMGNIQTIIRPLGHKINHIGWISYHIKRIIPWHVALPLPAYRSVPDRFGASRCENKNLTDKSRKNKQNGVDDPKHVATSQYKSLALLFWCNFPSVQIWQPWRNSPRLPSSPFSSHGRDPFLDFLVS